MSDAACLMKFLDQFGDPNSDEFKTAVEDRRDELQPKHVLIDDIIASMSYIGNLCKRSRAKLTISTIWATEE